MDRQIPSAQENVLRALDYGFSSRGLARFLGISITALDKIKTGQTAATKVGPHLAYLVHMLDKAHGFDLYSLPYNS